MPAPRGATQVRTDGGSRPDRQSSRGVARGDTPCGRRRGGGAGRGRRTAPSTRRERFLTCRAQHGMPRRHAATARFPRPACAGYTDGGITPADQPVPGSPEGARCAPESSSSGASGGRPSRARPTRRSTPPPKSQGAQVARGDERDVDLAVRAARTAFDQGPWPRMAAAERARVLWKLADLITTNLDEMARLESINTGKTLFDSGKVESRSRPRCSATTSRRSSRA